MQVIVLIEHDEIWEGTTMDVDSETEEFYHGILSERCGSYTGQLRKEFCIEVQNNLSFIERLVWFDDAKIERRRELVIKGILDEE